MRSLETSHDFKNRIGSGPLSAPCDWRKMAYRPQMTFRFFRRNRFVARLTADNRKTNFQSLTVLPSSLPRRPTVRNRYDGGRKNFECADSDD